MMKTLKFIVLLTVMLVNVTPYIKDGKVEWIGNEAAAQWYTIEYLSEHNIYLCGHIKVIEELEFYSTIKCEYISGSQNFRKDDSKASEFFAEAANSNPIEQSGFMLEDRSFIALSDINNTSESTKFPDMNKMNDDGYVYILVDNGSFLKIARLIHTHPNKDTAIFKYKPTSPEDWDALEDIGGKIHTEVQGQIYAPDGIYYYWFEEDGSRSYFDPDGKVYHDQ